MIRHAGPRNERQRPVNPPGRGDEGRLVPAERQDRPVLPLQKKHDSARDERDFGRDRLRAIGLKFLSIMPLTALLLFPGSASAADAAVSGNPNHRPNVLIIVTDDQPAGEDVYQVMPKTMELFGEGGTVFRQAVATTPLCCPARASILTGRYAHNHGVISQDSQPLNQRTTIAHYLQEAGYRTAIVGKFLNQWKSDPPYFHRWATVDKETGGYFESTFNVDGEPRPVKDYSTSYMTKTSIEYLRAFEKRDEQPWLLYIAPLAPHPPASPEPRYEGSSVPEFHETPSRSEVDRTDKPTYVQGLSFLTGDQAVPYSMWRLILLTAATLVTVGLAFPVFRARGKRVTLFSILCMLVAWASFVGAFLTLSSTIAWLSAIVFALGGLGVGRQVSENRDKGSRILAIILTGAGAIMLIVAALLLLRGDDGNLLVLSGRSLPDSVGYALLGALTLSFLAASFALAFVNREPDSTWLEKARYFANGAGAALLVTVVSAAVAGEATHKVAIEELRAQQLRSLRSVDDLVDRTFDTLEALDERNTLAFYLSDNGFLWYEHRLSEKRFPYNESVRIPLMMRWPGRVAEGSLNHDIVANIDVAPTIYDAAGLIEPHTDGRSLLRPVSRQHILLEYWNEGGAGVPTWSALWTPSWEYVEYGNGFREYYGPRDPWQLDNVLENDTSGDEPSNLGALAERLAEARSCVEGKCP